MDGRSLSTWWSTTTTGEVTDTTTTVWAENLGVEVGDTTLPVVVLPVSERLPAGTPQATLSFEIPEGTDSIFVDDRYLAPPAGGNTFTKAIDVAEGESRRVIVRLVDRNVWLDTVTFSRAMAPSEDKTGPTVELVAPDGDRTLSAGTRDILVRGRVTDPAGFSAVRLGNQDAVLSGASEWSPTVALQSDTNAIAVVATDAKGNRTSRVLLQVVVPPQSKDVRLVDLGLTAGYATVPAPGDTVWRVVVPNIAASVALHPLAGDRKATILHNGERVIDSIVVSLDPTGGVQELRLRVVSPEADSAQEHLVRIEHLQSDPIEFIPVGGATQLFSWADSLPSIAWRVSDNHRLDRVEIGNLALGYQPISPVGGDLYSRRVDLATLPNFNAFVIIARDSSGNTRSDIVRIMRRQDTAKPAFVRGLGAAMRSVPFDTTSMTVSWNVTDNHRQPRGDDRLHRSDGRHPGRRDLQVEPPSARSRHQRDHGRRLRFLEQSLRHPDGDGDPRQSGSDGGFQDVAGRPDHLGPWRDDHRGMEAARQPHDLDGLRRPLPGHRTILPGDLSRRCSLQGRPQRRRDPGDRLGGQRAL